MARENLNDLHAFVAVAREGNFTRAAGRLRLSPSALSHALRGLESRLGVRLLNRTTRSVSLTPAGERLLEIAGPRIDEIDAELTSLSEFREKPSGTIRVTTGEHAAETVLLPRLETFLAAHPDIKVEVTLDNGLTDIVAERYDAGIRLGEQVAKDMIAARIAPDLRMAVVGSPGYFENRRRPALPENLTSHNCLNLSFPKHGGVYAWEFSKDGRDVNVRVDGQLSFNNSRQILGAALRGLGLAYLPLDMVESWVAEGLLIKLLSDWCPSFTGYHLYYPSRHQNSAAFALFVEALRYRG